LFFQILFLLEFARIADLFDYLLLSGMVALTKSSGGDEASAICNAAFGNLIGVFFLPPVLMIGYIGAKGSLDILTVVYKLAIRVLVPIIILSIIESILSTISE
jgi:sodium/bile acid cotransporter 7